MTDESKATRWLNVRISKADHKRLFDEFKNTTCRSFSQYIMAILLTRKIVSYSRNKSLDEVMTEVVSIRKELNTVGKNLNQALRLLQVSTKEKERKYWQDMLLKETRAFTERQESLQNIFDKLGEHWLQK